MTTDEQSNGQQQSIAQDSDEASPPPISATPVDFPIVGIGASAGGLEAFERFFRACPPDTGMAFVLAPHLDPDHESLLSDILQRATPMPVMQAFDQVPVEADHIYVIPPNREMAILNGVLQLAVPLQAHGQRMLIDSFLRSLADDSGDAAIGVVLSGTATDGTLGMRAIYDAGGVCLVQEPSSAKFDGMPHSVIAAGYATHILPVEQMPAKLLELKRTSIFRQRAPRLLPENVVNHLNQILLQVRSVTGHDFSLYKKSTLGRRIERRMAQHKIEDIAIYARFIKQNPTEAQALFKEMLINVTRFFRDPESFVTLKREILPALLADKPVGYVFRVWVAGCASGEEAYSIAMLLREHMEATHTEFSSQIYATDLDADAIAQARIGRYPPTIAEDVAPERLRRFFNKDDAGNYTIKKSLRDTVVFAVHSVIKDPPFTKLDLLSCRNLMIYLEQEQQHRLTPLFHYALKPGGVLFLSNSESLASHHELFTVLNRPWKFYQVCHTTMAPTLLGMGYSPPMNMIDKVPSPGSAHSVKISDIAAQSTRTLLQCYAPASVTTDAAGNILYVHGDTSRYLRHPPGPLSAQVVGMARDELQLALRSAIAAAAQGAPTLNTVVAMSTGGAVSFSIRVLPPLPRDNVAENRLLLISFEEAPVPAHPNVKQRRSQRASAPVEASRIEQLERQLAYVTEHLQVTLEEQQASSEEFRSSNEELQSANEELQSANEELETSREELQSLNEETITVNTELNARIEQLSEMQDDMKNLFDHINVGTLFLDHRLVIRRYTPEAVKVYPLVASDIGRPLSDIKSHLQGEELLAEVQAVLDTLIPFEREVCTADGAWYLARIKPYRTLDNVIAGVVLTFIDITLLWQTREALRKANDQLRLAVVVRDAHDAITVQDLEGRTLAWNPGAVRLYGWSEAEALRMNVRERIPPEQREQALASLIHLSQAEILAPYRCQRLRKDGAVIDIAIISTALSNEAGQMYAVATTERAVTPQ